jgi:nicotinamide N-methyltransferase
LDDRWEDLCRGRRVLELGAGGGLPGLTCALNGAETVSTLSALKITNNPVQVVLTDYPDPDLLSNLEENVRLNLDAQIAPRVKVEVSLF